MFKQKQTGTKRVEFFDLANPNDVGVYEDLLNRDDVTITKDQVSFTKEGEPKIIVWYEEAKGA